MSLSTQWELKPGWFIGRWVEVGDDLGNSSGSCKESINQHLLVWSAPVSASKDEWTNIEGKKRLIKDGSSLLTQTKILHDSLTGSALIHILHITAIGNLHFLGLMLFWQSRKVGRSELLLALFPFFCAIIILIFKANKY